MRAAVNRDACSDNFIRDGVDTIQAEPVPPSVPSLTCT